MVSTNVEKKDISAVDKAMSNFEKKYSTELSQEPKYYNIIDALYKIIKEFAYVKKEREIRGIIRTFNSPESNIVDALSKGTFNYEDNYDSDSVDPSSKLSHGRRPSNKTPINVANPRSGTLDTKRRPQGGGRAKNNKTLKLPKTSNSLNETKKNIDILLKYRETPSGKKRKHRGKKLPKTDNKKATKKRNTTLNKKTYSEYDDIPKFKNKTIKNK
jgi:hypothetical protein